MSWHRRLRASALAPALLMGLVYGGWLLLYTRGHDVRDLIRIGPEYVRRSHLSSVIKLDPHYRYPGFHQDYDGQAYYYIALDPLHARPYLDEPSTRYTRIVYPLLARLLALGRADAIPFTLAWINVIAMGAGTYFVAAWLARRGFSPWISLIFGLYGGFAVAITRDLTDPLAYALVALAILLGTGGNRRNQLGAAAAFGVAALTRELAAIFALVYGLSLLAESRASGAGTSLAARATRTGWFLAVSLGPLLLWKAWLDFALNMREATTDVYPQPIPFRGILSYWPWGSQQVLEVITIVLPALVCGVMGVMALRRGLVSWPISALLLNVVIFVILLSPDSYFHYTASGRHSEGVMMAALYCLPTFDLLSRHRYWLVACAVCWTLVTPIIFLGTALCSPFSC